MDLDGRGVYARGPRVILEDALARRVRDGFGNVTRHKRKISSEMKTLKRDLFYGGG